MTVDPSRFAYDNTIFSPITPASLSFGASNPVGTFHQAAAASGNSWTGLRDVTPNIGGVTVPGMSTPAGTGMGTPLGMNLGTMNLALGGLQTIGNLWAAWEANKLAKKQFSFQKDITETNLANQISAYNTTLDDKIRSRAHAEGQSAEQAQAYIDQHSLRRKN